MVIDSYLPPANDYLFNGQYVSTIQKFWQYSEIDLLDDTAGILINRLNCTMNPTGLTENLSFAKKPSNKVHMLFLILKNKRSGFLIEIP